MTKMFDPQEAAFHRAAQIEAAMHEGRKARAEAMAFGAKKVWGTVFRILNPREKNLSTPAAYADC